MDETDPITPLQSATVRAALKAVAVNLLALVTVATGKAFDVDAVNHLVDAGATAAVNALSIYYAWKAYRGRLKATKVIRPEP